MTKEPKAPFRDTPLDTFDEHTDPSILSGDQYASDQDPGSTRAIYEKDIEDFQAQTMLGRFMHPEHDTSMRD
ncbi:DUF3905 domain-containing protein [Ferroacidibacillus organovorans]|uniref:DUF3905 domain-containing protein n=1 Tax=Ferroacidibacillus organovorans TaxID=1765683 RepID=UPI00128EFC1B|nr:DUF3905 domain-containing protein [Ferroacidibacillus organovorans]